MKLNQYWLVFCSLGFIALIGGFVSCNSTMHEPYEEFIKDGEIIYPSAPDSVNVYPGKNRIKLTWPVPSDPTISSARVYWHNKSDSVEVPIERNQGEDMVELMLTEMKEGSYSFDIYSFDDEENSSIKATAVGRVYGENYINSLLPRYINEALFADDTLRISWGSADEEAIATEVTYMDTSGNARLINTSGEGGITIVPNYDFENYSTFEYRTMYKPDSLAIDTFYTDSETQRVLGPRVELSKEAWSATASSYDERHGTARAPESAIDNDPSTIWVNSIDPQTYYPHWIKVDMGSVEEGIDGISFILQQRNETPKTIEISISNDDDNWTLIGRYTLENKSGSQYIDFSEIQDFRYFEVVTTEPQGNTNNIVIPEVGAFRR